MTTDFQSKTANLIDIFLKQGTLLHADSVRVSASRGVQLERINATEVVAAIDDGMF